MRSMTVVTVGRTPITTTALADAMWALAPQHFVPDPPSYASCIAHEEALGQQASGSAIKEECQAEYDTLKRRALTLLITSEWVVNEAQAKAAVPSGAAPVIGRDGILRGGRTRAAWYVKLLSARRIAAKSLRLRLRSGEPTITRARIARYYAHHRFIFEHRERRYFDIIEDLRNQADGIRLIRRLARKRRVTETPIHEFIDMPRPGQAVSQAKRALYRAIFAAPPRVFRGPLLLNGLYVIFRVTRIVPRAVRPLGRVSGEIGLKLSHAEHIRTLATFVGGWSARWTAKTACRPGYVVPGCREYRGSRAVENFLKAFG